MNGLHLTYINSREKKFIKYTHAHTHTRRTNVYTYAYIPYIVYVYMRKLLDLNCNQDESKKPNIVNFVTHKLTRRKKKKDTTQQQINKIKTSHLWIMCYIYLIYIYIYKSIASETENKNIWKKSNRNRHMWNIRCVNWWHIYIYIFKLGYHVDSSNPHESAEKIQQKL